MFNTFNSLSSLIADLASAAGFGLIYLGVSYATRRRLRANSQVIALATTQRIKTVQEGLGGIRDVLLDHTQPVYLKKFAGIDSTLRNAQAFNAMITAAPRFVIEGLGMVMIAMLALILSGQAGGLATTLPILGALALGAQRLLPLLQLVYTGWTSIMSSRGTLFDVLGFLDQPISAEAEAGQMPAPLPFTDAIEIRDLSFRYTDDAPLVLRDIMLNVRKGERIGLIGKTGSGKSTVVDLLMGLLTPTEGGILVDGVPLAPADIARWQVQVAHVPQHIYLSDATILENIAFGVPLHAIDEARVLEAARKAALDEFVLEQPDGFRSMVGERGVRLSGGQRQRIGIARALYKRSTVLILDEATSALDDATEASVMSALDNLDGDYTIFMIAHRVSTLRRCDAIYRLDRGRIVAQGSYEELVGSAARMPPDPVHAC